MYIYFTLKPLIFSDCPYYTPLTSIILFTPPKIALSFSSALYHGADHLKWLVSADRVQRYRDMYEKRAKSWPEDVILKLSNLATQSSKFSMDKYEAALVWTLEQLDQDHELEEFVAGIPGLYESEAFSKVGANGSTGDDIQRKLDNIRPVLAALPGPMGFDAPLPWSIIRLAQRAITSNLLRLNRQKRTEACLRALYYIPGAIRDLLAVYAAGKYHCTEVLPLLNSPESLKIIGELSNTSNDDVLLSVQCAAAVVAAFIITPPKIALDNYGVTDRLSWDEDTGKQFLEERFGDDSNAAPTFDLNSDTARMENITRFLADIQDTLQDMNKQQWGPDSAESILHQELFKSRHTIVEYVDGKGMFEQQGDRSSAAFMPAAQRDLITLTLEILARDVVLNATTSPREAFGDIYDLCTQLEQDTTTQARIPAHVAMEQVDQQPRPADAANSFQMVKLTLDFIIRTHPAPRNATPQAAVPTSSP